MSGSLRPNRLHFGSYWYLANGSAIGLTRLRCGELSSTPAFRDSVWRALMCWNSSDVIRVAVGVYPYGELGGISKARLPW